MLKLYLILSTSVNSFSKNSLLIGRGCVSSVTAKKYDLPPLTYVFFCATHSDNMHAKNIELMPKLPSFLMV
jgi:hypothetical protein